MKILVTGANGFIGRHVCQVLLAAGHEVIKAVRQPADGERQVDLADGASARQLIADVQPEAIIQAAGVVSNTEDAAQNPIMTGNVLQAVADADLQPKRIIILGSAAEYGIVQPDELPVKETIPLRGTSPYATSKIEESKTALHFRAQGLPVTVARIFNPIGPGMNERFLTTRIMTQLAEYAAGKRQSLEVNRLDAMRDYIHINDLAAGIQALAEGDPQQDIYNIGSGRQTSNGELVNLLIENSKIEPRPPVAETSTEPEPLFAAQADIERITSEFSWAPRITIEQAIKEIVDATQD